MSSTQALAAARDAFEAMVADIRPDLHRYCARMTGSAFDGEDVVQEALAKAFYALSGDTAITNLRGWLFRIAHNAALDHLRAGRRLPVPSDGPVLAVPDPDADPHQAAELRQAASAALGAFMRLPPRQRSCVALRDVLGHSTAEVAALLAMTPGAVKAAVSRGRTTLRTAGQGAPRPPADAKQHALLQAYIARFNARDFDAFRDMLADEVRLDLVGRAHQEGITEVGSYGTNYDRADDWRLGLGAVDGQTAIVVSHPDDPDTPTYFIRLTWDDTGRVAHILDFRYARYAVDGADIAMAA